VDLGGEAVGWKPFDLGVGVEEGAIDSVGCRAEDSVKSNSAWHSFFLSVVVFVLVVGNRSPFDIMTNGRMQ
jgi:hypothetical protein